MNNSDFLKIKEVIKKQLENENNNIKDFYIALVDALDKYPNLSLNDYKEIIIYIKGFNLDDYANYAKLFKRLLLIKMPKIKEYENNIALAIEKRNEIDKIDEIYNSVDKSSLNDRVINKINRLYKKTKDKILLLNITNINVSYFEQILAKFTKRINRITNNSKRRKRILISLISTFSVGFIIGFMLIGAIPKVSYMTVKEYNKKHPESQMRYYYTDKEIVCAGITGLIFPFHFPQKEVYISKSYNGEAVFGVAAKAFAENDEITRVFFPEKIAYIGDGAFKNCKSLQDIYVNKNGIYVPKALPEVNKIGTEAFYGCTSLNNLTLSENVEVIGKYAFSKCGSDFYINYSSSSSRWKLVYEYEVDFVVRCKSYTVTVINFYNKNSTVIVFSKEKYRLGALPNISGYEAIGYLYKDEMIAYADGISLSEYDYYEDIIVYAVYGVIEKIGE